VTKSLLLRTGMAARTIDGHISDTYVANGEGRVPNYVFEIGPPTIKCARPSDLNERRPSRNDVRLSTRGA
jgi:hypothetical protein